MVVLSFLMGVIVVIGIFIYTMQNYMLVKHVFKGSSFDDVNQAIEKCIPEHKGWGFPLDNWHFSKMLQSKGLKCENLENVMIHFVCNANHAHKMLSDSPFFSGMMPCSWSVYETQDGVVYISKMNIKLMSNIFFGEAGKVMKEVAQAEDMMMSKLREELEQN